MYIIIYNTMNDNDSDTFSITADKSYFIENEPKVINRKPKKPKAPVQEDKVTIPRRKKKTTN